MGKLVKKVELLVLGTFGIVFLCSSNLPGLLSTLDTATSPETYTASAAAAYIDDYSQPPPSPVTITTESTAVGSTQVSSSTSEKAPGDENMTTETDAASTDASDDTNVKVDQTYDSAQ